MSHAQTFDVKDSDLVLSRFNKHVFFIVGVALIVAASVWYFHRAAAGTASNKPISNATPAIEPTVESRKVQPQQTSTTKEQSDPLPSSQVRSSTADLNVSELAKTHNVAELMRQARRTSNSATQAFAAYMPITLCMSVSDARNLGVMTLKTDVPTRQLAHHPKAFDRITSRCAEYSEVELSLRGALLAELKATKAPMAAMFEAYRNERINLYADASVQETRAQLARVLNDERDATALQPLGLVWANRNAERFSSQLSEDLRPYAQNLVAAAFDIALCRAGAACGKDSVALDLVCIKFAECGVDDVEAAYSRLHQAVGIPFAETSRMAAMLEDAIRRGDTKVLWP